MSSMALLRFVRTFQPPASIMNVQHPFAARDQQDKWTHNENLGRNCIESSVVKVLCSRQISLVLHAYTQVLAASCVDQPCAPTTAPSQDVTSEIALRNAN